MNLPTDNSGDLFFSEEEEQRLLRECNDPDFFVPITDAQFENMLQAMEQIRSMINEQESNE